MLPIIVMFTLVTIFPTDLSATPWACLSLVGEVSIRYPREWQYYLKSSDWYPVSISTLIFLSMAVPLDFHSGWAKNNLDIISVSSTTSLDLVNTGYTCREARSVNLRSSQIFSLQVEIYPPQKMQNKLGQRTMELIALDLEFLEVT